MTAAADPEYRLELQNGAAETIRRFEVADAVLTSRDLQPASIPLGEIISLRRVGFQDDWTERSTVLWLTNGDRIVGEPTEITEDSLTVRWLQFPASDSLTIPLEYVASISLHTPASTTARQRLFRQLTTDAEDGDVAWLVSGDRVSGQFTGFSRGEFHFNTEAGRLPIVRNKLLALRFDPELVSRIKLPPTRYVLSFSDGSRLTASDFKKNHQHVTCSLVLGAEMMLPAEELVGVHVFSPRLLALSQRPPESSEFTPYLAGKWPWIKDGNVLHGPLQVRGQEFVHGLGVHSRTTLSYAIEPKDREFRAVVGIDDAAEGKGHVVFQVAVDDEVLWQSPAVTGASKPIVVPPVDLRGGKRLALTVEFGESGDVRDYADWCEAIILRGE